MTKLTLHIAGQAGYPYRLKLTGDTYEIKEEIKAIKYIWEEEPFGWNPKKAWQKETTDEKLLTEVRRAMELGAVVNSCIQGNDRLNNILNSSPLEKIKQAEEMLLAKRQAQIPQPTIIGPIYDDDDNPTYYVDGRRVTEAQLAQMNI